MKKTVEWYMQLPYKMEIVPDLEDGGFVISFPELPGCITCADTIEEALANAKDAKRAWMEATLGEGLEIPEPNDALMQRVKKTNRIY